MAYEAQQITEQVATGSSTGLYAERRSAPALKLVLRRGEERFLRAHWAGKRIFDIAGAIALLMVFLPVFAFVAVTLRRERGPILFGHERIGLGGRRFKVYKFRSMVPDADQVLGDLLERDPEARAEWERDFKLRNDPRVTRIGRFLRKTSLDELPQLWNVLKGEMSLVGPRPIVPHEIARYGRAARYYLAAKPGLTGLWQVSGRNDAQYIRRVALDRKYTHIASLSVDLNILLRTVGVVLFGRGAY